MITAKGWVGLALMVAGAGYGLGFFFAPPHILIPELIWNPDIHLFPEGIVGIWVAAVGLALLIGDRRDSRHARRRKQNRRNIR